MNIIVNADDLGMSASVNDAIFQAMAAGSVSSATILANGPSVTQVTGRLPEFPQCSFGVHLNLTQYEPLCPSSLVDLAAILDDRGCFNGNSIREVRIDVRMLRAIYREWCAQIDRVIALGVEPSHLDAHHHVHTIPQMLPVLAALRRRYKIRRVRISRNLYEDFERPSRGLLTKKLLYNRALRSLGFRTTQVFADFLTFIHLYTGTCPRYRSVELMTHPGSSPGGEEANLLRNGWTQRLGYGVSLISYHGI